jgi:hypothetical protein
MAALRSAFAAEIAGLANNAKKANNASTERISSTYIELV